MDLGIALAVLGIGVAAFASAVLGGIAGIGTAIAMIPVLTLAFGVREAIPIIGVAMLLNNTGRWWVNRAFVDYRVVKWFVLGAVPAAALGAVAFANAPASLLARGLGIFLLVLVVYRHVPLGRGWQMGVRGFLPVGAGQGFLTSLFGGAGPFGVHFWLSYGVVRGAFVGSTAVATNAINLTRTGVYGGYALLDGQAFAIGGAIGLIMMLGAYVGGLLVRRVSDRTFVYIVEGVMIVSGTLLAVRG